MKRAKVTSSKVAKRKNAKSPKHVVGNRVDSERICLASGHPVNLCQGDSAYFRNNGTFHPLDVVKIAF